MENVKVLAAEDRIVAFKILRNVYQTESCTFRSTYLGLFKECLSRISQGTVLAAQMNPSVLLYFQRQSSQRKKSVLSDKQKLQQA